MKNTYYVFKLYDDSKYLMRDYFLSADIDNPVGFYLEYEGHPWHNTEPTHCSYTHLNLSRDSFFDKLAIAFMDGWSLYTYDFDEYFTESDIQEWIVEAFYEACDDLSGYVMHAKCSFEEWTPDIYIKALECYVKCERMRVNL